MAVQVDDRGRRMTSLQRYVASLTAVAATLASANLAVAEPRGAALFQGTRMVEGLSGSSASDVNLANDRAPGNAKAYALEQSFKKTPVLDNRTGRSSYASAAIKAGLKSDRPANTEVQVAPLK